MEFAEMMMPIANTLHPTEVSEVWDRQIRPSQRSLLRRAIMSGPYVKRVLNVFLKREAYGEPKDPRIISTINPVDKQDYSRYMYAFAEVLKTTPWYAFGKSNFEVANRVGQICCSASKHCINTDFSRFDGHVSPAARHVERVIVLRAFHQDHHPELLELLRSQYNMRAFMACGHSYEGGFARASGSPETSAFNSVLNAFTNYVAYRNTMVLGRRCTPEMAYSRLGIYGGDDGLSADLIPSNIVKAAKMLGQIVEVEPIPRGVIGVKFLARLYGPDVWFGDVNSVADINRQLSKFHATVNLPKHVTPKMKFAEKARAFCLTDRNTPLLGELCELAHQFAQQEGIERCDYRIGSYAAYNEHSDAQYPNAPSVADWALEHFMTQVPHFDKNKFYGWLYAAQSLDDLLSPPLFAEPRCEVKLPVRVDGEIIHPAPRVNVRQQPARPRRGPGLKRPVASK